MSATVKSLGIDRLPREVRLALVQEIWDTIAAEPGSLLSEAQRSELERRISQDDTAPDDVVAWEKVKAQAVSRLQKP